MENSMAISGREVWRDFVSDGIPSSGKHDPKKPDIRQWATWIEQIIAAFTSNGGLIYSSKAALDADLAHGANSMAWVIGDATAANNGVYRKLGASGSGSWTRAADLPYSFIRASNVGSGTPSAIQATTDIPVSSSALILLTIAEDYVGTAATVSFNGQAPLAIKTNSGEDVRTLAADSVVYGVISGSTFRLASDEAIASLIYAARDEAVAAMEGAEAAEVAAEAARDIAAGYASDAVSQGNVPIYATIDGMPALEVPVGINAIRVNGWSSAGDGLGGLFIDTDNGSTDTFTTNSGTRTWYRAADVGPARVTDELDQIIQRPKRPKKLKIIAFGDFQPLPSVPEQMAMRIQYLQDIEANHKDADYIIFLGDLVDSPTTDSNGTPSGYTYQMLLADIRQYVPSIPLSRWLIMPGNHDRDTTGVGAWRWASSYNSYRTEIGPLFYHVDIGNVRIALMGDMAGSSGGEILDLAIDWFDKLMNRSRSMNVLGGIHQPTDPSVYPPNTNPLSSAFQYRPERLTNIVSAHDNVSAMMYGHIGAGINNATTVAEAYGTTWIDCQNGIEQAQSNGRPMFYTVFELVDGSSEIAFRRWNASEHEWLGLNDVTVATKYPVQLSGDALDFDGRVQQQRDYMTSYGPATVWWSQSETRGAAAPHGPSSEKTIMQNLILLDDSNDGAPIGSGTATAYWVPGQATVTTSDGFNITGVPGAGVGAIAGARRTVQANQEDWQAAYEIHVRDNTGALPLLASFLPATASAGGLDLKGAAYLIDGTLVVDRNRKFRLRSYTAAELSNLTANPSTPFGQLVMCSDGDAGLPCLAVSRGGSGGWARIPLGANVSATS